MTQEPTAEQKEPGEPESEAASAVPESRPRLLPALRADEWHLFAITFVAGVASIVVGAAMIGISLALARIFWNERGAWWTLAGYFGAGVLGVTLGVTGWRFRSPWRPLRLHPSSPRELMVGRHIMFWTGACSVTIAVLVLIGKAAGVH
jgi:hypothetical protein